MSMVFGYLAKGILNRALCSAPMINPNLLLVAHKANVKHAKKLRYFRGKHDDLIDNNRFCEHFLRGIISYEEL